MFPAERNPRLDRVEYELRSSGVKPEQLVPLRSGTHSRGYLPHVKREGARYFLTFRLDDSLPKEVLLKIQAERANQLTRFYAEPDATKQLGAAAPESSRLDQIERDYFRKVEGFLDKGNGECWLRQPEIAQIAADAFRYFDGQRYLLRAWVIMPNHAHLVLWPMPNHTLSAIVQSLKRYTSREANKVLDRTGQTFWQPFDHWIRNDEEHERCCRYVVNNPVKARLCDAPNQWRWSSAWQRASL